MAFVLRTSGAIVLHVPKTGGTWVRDALQEQDRIATSIGPKHLDGIRLRAYATRHPYLASRKALRYGPRELRSLMHRPTIAFVRDPVDWYTSWWHYMVRIDWHSWEMRTRFGTVAWHPLLELMRHPPADLDDFISSFVRQHPAYLTEVFRRYTLGAAFVGHQEQLADDLARALDAVGEPWDPEVSRAVPMANASQSDASQQVREETADLVRRNEPMGALDDHDHRSS